jgi:hypothetical protein
MRRFGFPGVRRPSPGAFTFLLSNQGQGSWGFYLGVVLTSAMLAVLETAVDPISAWERCIVAMFGIGVPCLALKASLDFYRAQQTPSDPSALRARHGADRRHLLAGTWLRIHGASLVWFCVALLVCRVISHSALEAVFNRDLLYCTGIGCLATTAYIAFFAAATRLGAGRTGAWVAFWLNLTLGHVNAAWSAAFPHRHVAILIGHPDSSFFSAYSSSWILLGFVVVGLSITALKTPR